MAQIIYEHHEDITRALVEAALETREIGYTDAASYQELIIKIEAGGYRHFPSLERLDDAGSAASGAALIGFYPNTAGMVATTVQAAIEELKAAGTGGTLTGAGVAGRVAMWTGATTMDDVSFLDIVGSTLQFGGDPDTALYVVSAGELGVDGHFYVGGTINCDTVTASQTVHAEGELSGDQYAIFGLDYLYDDAAASGSYVARLFGTLTKNNSNTRTFYGMFIDPTFNAGGSNANTTYIGLYINTTNTGVTGLTTILIQASYGGSLMFEGDSDGDWYNARDAFIGRNGVIQYELTVGLSMEVITQGDGYVVNYFTAAVRKNDANARNFILNKFEAVINTGGSNANTTMNILDVNTVNTAVTGVTLVNLLKMSYGSSEKYRFQHNGTFYVFDGTPIMYMYSTGFPGDTDYEYGAIIKSSSFFTIATGAGGTGARRSIVLSAVAAGNAVAFTPDRNVSFFGNTSFNSGEGVLLLQDAIAVPTGNNAGGGYLYSEAGALKWRGTSGTITTVAPA